MAYIGRDWNNTGTKVTKEDFKRIEEGIKNNDNQINVLNNERGYLETKWLEDESSINNLLLNGRYKIWTPVERPSGFHNGILIDVFNERESSYITQLIRDFEGRMAIRSRNNSGVWSDWQQIATTTVATPTPVNGWTQYEGHQPIKLIKIGKMVNLVGFVNIGVTTANTIMLTGIPVGFRPSSVQAIRVADLDVRIPTDGTMVLMSSKTPSYNCYNGICWEV